MKKKFIIFNILMIFQSNQLIDPISTFLYFGAIAWPIGWIIVGNIDEYIWANKPLTKQIKRTEELLKKPSYQNERHQNGFKQRLAILKERLKKEQEAEKKMVSKKGNPSLR